MQEDTVIAIIDGYKGGDNVLKDCLDIFREELDRIAEKTGDEDRLILDEYIPADGDYLLVKRDGTIETCSVKFK